MKLIFCLANTFRYCRGSGLAQTKEATPQRISRNVAVCTAGNVDVGTGFEGGVGYPCSAGLSTTFNLWLQRQAAVPGGLRGSVC